VPRRELQLRQSVPLGLLNQEQNQGLKKVAPTDHNRLTLYITVKSTPTLNFSLEISLNGFFIFLSVMSLLETQNQHELYYITSLEQLFD